MKKQGSNEQQRGRKAVYSVPDMLAKGLQQLRQPEISDEGEGDKRADRDVIIEEEDVLVDL
jgi:hypothetical protein